MADMAFLFGEPDMLDRMVEELRKTPGWPVDDVRDRALIGELVREFPNLDLTDEFGKFRVWLLAKGKGREVASRGRFQRVRNWCSNAVRYGTSPGGSGAGRKRTSTAARPAGSFGGESSVTLHRW